MREWLLLYLASLLHCLGLFTFNLKGPGVLLCLPIAALPFFAWLKGRHPAWFNALTLRIAGLLALGFALIFLTQNYQGYWDTRAWRSDLLVSGLGLTSLWVACGSGGQGGSAAWLWIGLWLFSGVLDPLMPFLGAGVSACAGACWRPAPKQADASFTASGPALFLLGLVLSKPWWDWGLDPHWAWAMGAFGLGAALALAKPLERQVGKVPPRWALGVVGALGILYLPQWILLWGLVLGLAWGVVESRPRQGSPVQASLSFLGGLLLSFALHANAWLPGLRHLIWLGN